MWVAAARVCGGWRATVGWLGLQRELVVVGGLRLEWLEGLWAGCCGWLGLQLRLAVVGGIRLEWVKGLWAATGCCGLCSWVVDGGGGAYPCLGRL